VIIRPSTLLKFHNMLKKRKYRLLYSARRTGKPGPKGPSQALIDAIVELKKRNTRFGRPRIAQQINKAFGVDIDNDVVRRVLEKHYRQGPDSGHGPSWLTFIGHLKDSLLSIDLFRCESILLKTHWVLVVMDQLTRRIIGFGVHAGDVDEIKSIPYTPRSHHFIERLIGTLRREFLDHTLFWNTVDLERKLELFKDYYNYSRTHASLDGNTPAEISGDRVAQPAPLYSYARQKHCGVLFQLPVAA